MPRVSVDAVLGYLLVGVGLALALIVFKYSIDAYHEYRVALPEAGSVEALLAGGAEVLLDLLVRVAFLGVALAAASVLLARGVDLLKRK